MASEPVQPYVGPMAADISSMQSILVDVAPGGMRRFRRQQEGIAGVIAELSASASVLAGPVGLSPEVYARFQTLNDNLDQIRAAREIVDKMAEVLAESEAKYENDREAVIGKIADAVKSAARRTDRSLLAPFAQTVAYNAQVAVRAAKTRRKNAEQGEDETQAEPAPAPSGA